MYKDQGAGKHGKIKYTFYVRVMGVSYRKTVTCPRSAVVAIHRKWENYVYKNAGKELNESINLYEAFDLYLEEVKISKTSTRYKYESRSISRFKELFTDIPLQEFNREHVLRFRAWRKKNVRSIYKEEVSDATINRDIASLSCFFTFCILRNYYTGNNPAFKTKLKEGKRKVRLSSKHVAELLAKAKSYGHLYMAILLAIGAGLRKKEICGLKWSDIHLDENNERIEIPAKIAKCGKERVVWLPSTLAIYLKKKSFTKTPSEYVIIYKGRPVTNFKKTWEHLRERLSFKNLDNGLFLHFHDLRHVYAQALKDAGVPMSDIQHQLGHSSVVVTEQLYAQFENVDLHEKVNRINGFLEKAIKKVK